MTHVTTATARTKPVIIDLTSPSPPLSPSLMECSTLEALGRPFRCSCSVEVEDLSALVQHYFERHNDTDQVLCTQKGCLWTGTTLFASKQSPHGRSGVVFASFMDFVASPMESSKIPTNKQEVVGKFKGPHNKHSKSNPINSSHTTSIATQLKTNGDESDTPSGIGVKRKAVGEVERSRNNHPNPGSDRPEAEVDKLRVSYLLSN
ncbi:hypothetical protein LA080_007205 [Diaporthe eres]|nr:hypothetical protein LA080_007205 [Diaporthe eres]